jgi:hypothetical protein
MQVLRNGFPDIRIEMEIIAEVYVVSGERSVEFNIVVSCQIGEVEC